MAPFFFASAAARVVAQDPRGLCTTVLYLPLGDYQKERECRGSVPGVSLSIFSNARPLHIYKETAAPFETLSLSSTDPLEGEESSRIENWIESFLTLPTPPLYYYCTAFMLSWLACLRQRHRSYNTRLLRHSFVLMGSFTFEYHTKGGVESWWQYRPFITLGESCTA
jgi:hypothetical protein